MSSQQDAVGVLVSNHAMRSWAEGLRLWSRSARETSSAERMRSRRLVAHRQSLALDDPSTSNREGRTEGAVLPAFGDVQVDELLAVLVRSHGFGAVGAVRALQLAMLVAGYPPDTDDVLAADALPILDSALDYPR